MSYDKHDLYELCVQSPKDLVPLVCAIHGNEPKILGEDFAGTSALSHLWVEKNTAAIAVDLDADALAFRGEHPQITKHCCDVREISDECDVIFVGNFSIGYLHTRTELVEYLKHTRQRLEASNGVFICDTYGGETAYTLGGVHRAHPMPGGKLCRYTWEQHEADPTTGMVTNLIHFRIERAGVIEDEIFDAFVYEWRLWSIPELRDAMADAGFTQSQVYAKLADAVDEEGNAYITPVQDAAEELEDSFIVLIAGRV
jgi:hypothetical protein